MEWSNINKEMEWSNINYKQMRNKNNFEYPQTTGQ